MPLFDVALQINVEPKTDPTVVVRGVTAAEKPTPTTEELLTLYQEVGEHERHYSNIRMTATALLVLRCLAWVATISVWKHEIEFGCEQVNHGFEVAD